MSGLCCGVRPVSTHGAETWGEGGVRVPGRSPGASVELPSIPRSGRDGPRGSPTPQRRGQPRIRVHGGSNRVFLVQASGA